MAPGKDKKDRPSKEQAGAYRYLLDHDKAVQQAILARIVAAYPGIREKYGPVRRFGRPAGGQAAGGPQKNHWPLHSTRSQHG